MNQYASTTARPRFLTFALSLALFLGGVPFGGLPGASAAPRVTSATLVPVTAETSWVSSDVIVILDASKPPTRGAVKIRYALTGAQTGTGLTSTLSTSVSLSAEGTTAVSFCALDSAGAPVEATQTVQVRIDRSPPKTTSNRMASYPTPATITLSASDTFSGVAATYYILDGELQKSGTTVQTSKPGLHTLQFWSVDKAGNRESTSTPGASNVVTFTVTTGDAVRPTTTAIGRIGAATVDLAGWLPKPVTVTLVATDGPAGSGVAATRYRLNGGPTVDYTHPLAVTAEGTTTLQYWSVDRAGNEEIPKTASIRIDTVRPSVSVEATSAYEDVGIVRVTGADDRSGVASISWRVDQGSIESTAKALVQVRVSRAGTHTVECWATDFAGNSSKTTSVTFHVRTKPALAWISKTASVLYGTRPTVAGRFLDGTFGVPGMRLVLDYSTSSAFARYSSVNLTSTVNGAFSVLWSPLRVRTYFRVRYAGGSDFRETTGTVIVYTPRPKLVVVVPTTAIPRYTTFAVSGRITPAHPRGSRSVRIDWYKSGTTRRVGYVWASVTPKGTYSSFVGRLKLPAGRWKIAVVAPADAAHAASTVTRIVTVR